MIIAIDFDGTCVTHEFPKVGKDIGAIPILRRLVKEGHNLILWTMRSRKKEGNTEPGSLGWDNGNEIILETDVLQDAINWFDRNDILLYGINNNPDQINWTNSPKAYAQLYIDDAALGCPTKFDKFLSDREFVDWDRVKSELIRIGVLSSE